MSVLDESEYWRIFNEKKKYSIVKDFPNITNITSFVYFTFCNNVLKYV